MTEKIKMPLTSIIEELFKDIKLLINSNNTKYFYKKYLKKIKLLNNIMFTNITPIQYYINLGNYNNSIIEFLLPSDFTLLFNKDSDGETISHRLVINNKPDILEYLFFIIFNNNKTIRKKILKINNSHNLKLYELIILINIDNSHSDMKKSIDILMSKQNFEEKKIQYLQRIHQKTLAQECNLLDTPNKDNKKLCINSKPIGKRRILNDILKNNNMLQRKLNSSTNKYTYCYTFDKINLYVKSGHIHYIDNLYIYKNFSDDINNLLEQIPYDWNIGTIRFINNTFLDDPTITFIAELTFDYMNQTDSDTD
jgi:hypothetical protein